MASVASSQFNSDIKKPRNNKQLPLELAGFDMDRFLKAPYLIKLLKNTSSINNISPIKLTNITESLYTQLVDKSNTNLFKYNEGGVIGFTIHFSGTKDDQHILYAFDSSWADQEDKSEFGSWFNSAYESSSLGIISNEIRGWGAKKICNIITQLEEQFENFEIHSETTLEISQKAATSKKKTVIKINPTVSQKNNSQIDEGLANLIKSLVEQQKAFQKQLNDQQDIIQKLLSVTTLSQ